MKILQDLENLICDSGHGICLFSRRATEWL